MGSLDWSLLGGLLSVFFPLSPWGGECDECHGACTMILLGLVKKYIFLFHKFSLFLLSD